MKYIKLSFCLVAILLFSSSIVLSQTCTDIPSGGPYVNIQDALPCDATCGTPVSTPFDLWQNESYLLGVLTAGSEYTFTVAAGAAACGAGFTGTMELAVYEWDGAAFVGAPLAVEADICTAGSLTVTIPADGEYILVVNDTGDCAVVGGTDSGVLSVDCGPNGATCVPPPPPPPVPPVPEFLTCSGGNIQEELYNTGDDVYNLGAIVSSTNDQDNLPLGAICGADFVVGAGGMTIEGVYAPGSWSASYITGLVEGNITDVTIIIYQDAPGAPGAVVCTATEVPLNAAAAMMSGYLEVELTTPCVLAAGTYWISIEVNADNRWNWGVGTGTFGLEAQLIDPADYFGAGATSWTSFGALGLPAGTDMAFGLVACSSDTPPPCDLTITIDQTSCDDAGTSDDASDDIIEYTVTVSGGVGTWSDAGIGVAGQAYGTPTAPFTVTGAGSITVTAIDDADATCTATLTDELPGCAQPAVPTLSQWGLMTLALLLMVFGAIKIGAPTIQTVRKRQ